MSHHHDHDHVFAEGTTRMQGKDARRMNTGTIRVISDSLKATLAPAVWIKCWSILWQEILICVHV